MDYYGYKPQSKRVSSRLHAAFHLTDPCWILGAFTYDYTAAAKV